MSMIAVSVQSGSNGNCIYVQTPGARLIFDAGVSGICAQRRLAALGVDISAADAMMISHDHSDHVRCAGVFNRKFGLPLYITAATLRGAQEYRTLGPLSNVTHFDSGSSVTIGDAVVHTFRTPHDACDGVAFVVESHGRRLGVLTDLGHVFDGLGTLLGTLDAVFLESNYDPASLESGPYPWHLKQRIRGPRGHLSNFEAAELLRLASGRLRWAALSHLSGENNSPELAMATARSMLGKDFPLVVASREGSSGIMEV
jgi:phosphoribosyl 1,2-cyclic phosphodiesterase